MPRSRGGGKDGALVGVGRHCDVPPPASSSRCSDSCRGGMGVTSETMEDKQTTIKS
jgi:hypothetical protein